jgi:hypothetical protein
MAVAQQEVEQSPHRLRSESLALVPRRQGESDFDLIPLCFQEVRPHVSNQSTRVAITNGELEPRTRRTERDLLDFLYERFDVGQRARLKRLISTHRRIGSVLEHLKRVAWRQPIDPQPLGQYHWTGQRTPF